MVVDHADHIFRFSPRLAPYRAMLGTAIGLLAPTTWRWGLVPVGMRAHPPPGLRPFRRRRAPDEERILALERRVLDGRLSGGRCVRSLNG
jgi:hypothetical protein